jgi:uncharacterized protein YggE
MRNKLLVSISVMVLVMALAACGPSGSSQSSTLNVTGSGLVSIAPDIAYIYVGVNTVDTDIAQAVNRNNAQAQALADALKNAGVAPEDIQTSNFSVWSSPTTDPMTGTTNGYSYTVDNTVYLTVRDLSQLGSLLNTVVNSGANNINSITFDVADKTAAMTQARQKAMDNAASLADELAQTAGLTLGKITNITYTESGSYYPYYGMGGGGAEAPNASVPIAPGLTQISVTVDVTYSVH